MTAVDDLVEEMCGLRGVVALDSIEPELVDQKQVPFCVVLQGLGEALVGKSGGELKKHLC